MIAKPGKPPNEISSCRPIAVLPVLTKLFEKLIINQLKPIIVANKLILMHQFGLREKHSTIDQVHRSTDVIENAFGHWKYAQRFSLMFPKRLTRFGMMALYTS